MKDPTCPIFVVEGLDNVSVYGSVEGAELSLEPWWVEQEEGKVYDAEGRLLKLEIDHYNVRISLPEDGPVHASKLEGILRSNLKAIGEPIGNDLSCGLPCLVAFCRKFISRPRPIDVILDGLLNFFARFIKR